MMRAALDLFRPGATVYLPGASGESVAFAETLANDPGRLDGVHVVSCPFPGVNTHDYASLHPAAAATVFMPPTQARATIADGRTRVLPFAYSHIAKWLRHEAAIDIAVAHVSPPDAEGLCSLGIAVDFTPVAWASAKQRILLVNPTMPRMRWGPWINVSQADVVVDAPGPVVTVEPVNPDDTTLAAARRAAALIPDGARLQVGLGTAPGAIWRYLRDHRGLVLASGMIADGFMPLHEVGAMAEGDHYAGVILGGGHLSRFVADIGTVRMAPVSETHDVARLAALSSFTAVNGALEVDLFGQINLEWQDGRMVSGVGGAPDFAAGALASKGGRAITVLPSMTRNGVSRIVPRLDMPASLGRREADTIVTEHGFAELRGRSVDARADALIAIAAPARRDALATAWDEIRRKMWAAVK